jgi:hypothetical protein
MVETPASPTESAIAPVYVSKVGYQPVCAGVDPQGELLWDLQMKAPWHSKMFPVRYQGDFGEQWMWLSLMEKGLEWDRAEGVDEGFARSSRKLLRKLTNKGKVTL